MEAVAQVRWSAPPSAKSPTRQSLNEHSLTVISFSSASMKMKPPLVSGDGEPMKLHCEMIRQLNKRVIDYLGFSIQL
jgi:hypothetical protein